MSLPVLETARLVLRPLVPGDAPAVAAGIGDWRVMQWLSTPPWPYGLADAEWFIGDEASADCFGLVPKSGDAVAGTIDVGAELGYWLAPSHWGAGLMREAAEAALAWRFGQDQSPISSGYFVGNGPSRAVLTGLGFAPTRIVARYHAPLKQTLALQEMVLTREVWESRQGGAA
ncbi:GNAT family N-acetyltransferase [Pseudoroseicyclus sp. H15]